jgi:hypothetical protein
VQAFKKAQKERAAAAAVAAPDKSES